MKGHPWMEADNLQLACLSRVSGPSLIVIAPIISGARIECIQYTVAHAAYEASSIHIVHFYLLAIKWLVWRISAV